jgi:uncharacterized protein YutE (UPF0331/DUF86 family)
MTEELLNILQEDLNNLKESTASLEYSYKKCIGINFKKEFNEEELESFEALTSRFARVCDIITQKVLKSIDVIDLETPGTLRDIFNRSEKKNIIPSAKDLVDIRILRNEIVHDYLPEMINDIFKKVLTETPKLFDIIDLIQKYCKEKYKV